MNDSDARKFVEATRELMDSCEIFVGTKPPQFGRCNAVDCDAPATDETLIGLRFCQAHYSAFYSPEDFAINPEREHDLSER